VLRDSVMVRKLLGPLVACVQIFALYVVLHGHYGPGGGFQGGVLLGCSWILPILVHGHRSVRGMISARGAQLLALSGVLVFLAVGAAPMANGGGFLDHGALPLPVDPPLRHSLGILIIEVGVAIAVAGVVVSLSSSLKVVDEDEAS